MSEPKKLNADELAGIERWRVEAVEAIRVAGQQNAIEPWASRFNRVVTDFQSHIAAMEAEQRAGASRAASDAFEVGHANATFIEQQTDHIKKLEDIMLRIAALGVAESGENLGVMAGRMCYMRDSLRAALKGDYEPLEIFEAMFRKDK